jgi:DNA-3-methyladenine glycosylase
MLKRRNLEVMHPNVSAGPGKLTRALGITLQHNGRSILHDQELWIEPHKISNSNEIAVSPRIGVDYAQEDAMLPWRFFLRNSPWVSKP